jgi:hypothetical protein
VDASDVIEVGRPELSHRRTRRRARPPCVARAAAR